MNSGTKVFLVLLRVAIGWHFLFEGLDKVHTHQLGDIPGNKPWTSEGYFREASGPLGPLFRSVIGDPDERALALLTVRPGDKPEDRVPKALHDDWTAYRQRLVTLYALPADQAAILADKQRQQEDAVVVWLTAGKRDPYTVTYPSGAVETTKTIEELVAEYRAKVREVRHTVDEKMYAFGADVEGLKLRTLKADVAKLRGDLLGGPAAKPGEKNPIDSLGEYDEECRRVLLEAVPAAHVPGLIDKLALAVGKLREEARAIDLDKPSPIQVERLERALTATSDAADELEKGLPTLPEGEDKGRPAVAAVKKTLVDIKPILPETTATALSTAGTTPGALFSTLTRQVDDLKRQYRPMVERRSALEADQKARGTLATPAPSAMLRFIDFTTRWGLVAIGSLLILGLFSRSAALGGAAFLTMVYLSTPAFPWLPTPPNTEGHYLFVNKNIVELFALLALATTASGKWFGLDAGVAWLLGKLGPPRPATPVEAPPG